MSGEPIDHIAGIFDVKRLGDDILFKVGELNVGVGKHTNEYALRRIKDESGINYYIDSRFRNKGVNFFYCSNKTTFTKVQNTLIAKYWSTPAVYKFTQLPFTINWVYFLFADKKKIYDHFCNGAAYQSVKPILGLNEKDKVQNPAQFTENNFLKPKVRIVE